MELSKELLLAALSGENVHITVSGIPENLSELTSDLAVKALMQIKSILSNDTLSDPECFQQIEEIVTVFEKLEIGCGLRHDFG